MLAFTKYQLTDQKCNRNIGGQECLMTTTLGMTVTLKRYQEQGTDAEDLEAESHG